MLSYKILITKCLIYFIFCFSLFHVAPSFAIEESSFIASGTLFHIRPVKKEEIPAFIEKYAIFAGQQCLEAGEFSHADQAIDYIRDLEKDSLYGLQGPSFDENFYQEWKKENCLFYIYQDQELMPCGLFWYKISHDDQDAFIQVIFLEAEYRGMGIGSIILNQLATELKAQGFQSLFLHVFSHNIKAYHLYKRLGYEELLFGIEDGVSSLYMVKELND